MTDPTPANNSATDTDTLTPQADVSITKTDGATSEVPGTSVTYTIVASNAGPSNAPSVTVADTFPADCTGATWTCSGAGGATCAATGSGNISDTASLPVGGSATYTATCTISPAATGTLTNTATATVGGGVTDPTPGNNSATDTDTLALPGGFYTVTPCRFFDTRNASLGGPSPLAGGSTQVVPVVGQCAVPATAKAVSLNVTVTQPGAPGFLTLYPSGTAKPAVSVINFSQSQTRANNAVVPLGATGEIAVFSGLGVGFGPRDHGRQRLLRIEVEIRQSFRPESRGGASITEPEHRIAARAMRYSAHEPEPSSRPGPSRTLRCALDALGGRRDPKCRRRSQPAPLGLARREPGLQLRTATDLASGGFSGRVLHP